MDWNYELVENTLHGLKKYTEEHENVQVCVFDCFGKDVYSPKSKSEYAIFELPDLSRFDGVIVQGNQIVYHPAREALGRRIQENGVPAVSIDCPMPGCMLVEIDNKQAQYEMSRHVMEAHGARRLVYLTGLLDNGSPEGRLRLDGFLDACRDCGVREEDVTVIPCTWRTDDGKRVVTDWLREEKPLPDAFICANDEMAMGVLEALEKNGYRIPKDVIVTGFDNLSSSQLSSPRLSTVDRNNERLNYFAMEVLLRRIQGREEAQTVPFPHGLVCSESCGCRDETTSDYIRSQYFHQTRFLKNFYILQDQMAEQMFEAADLPELMGIVEDNERIFGCGGVYLCINDYYFDNYEKKQWQHDSESFGEEMILATRGSSGLPRDPGHQYARFPVQDLLPRSLMNRQRFWMFYPLHYNTYSIGYLAIDGISEAAKLNLHESIFSFLEIAIENVRKKCLLRQLNSVLDDLYVRDSLTGLYNRFGYKRFGQAVFDRYLEEGSAQVLFIDMDDMKAINDRFGHESGDAAICATADILRRACSPGDFVMRYGGDEFLVIASGRIDDLKARIHDGVHAFNAGGVPYQLFLSIGVARASRGDGRTLEDCVQLADAQMYDKKNKRKAERK